MRNKLQYPTFIAVLFSLLVLSACTKSASTPPPGETVVLQTVEVEVTRMVELPTPTPLPPTDPPEPTAEPVSRFTDITVTYYVYRELVWSYDHGYIESCGTVPEPITVSEPTAESSPTAEETTEASPAPEENKEEATGAPAPIPICPEDPMLHGDFYVSSDRYIHQDANFEPPTYSNIAFRDRGIAGAPEYAAAVEDLSRNWAMPKFFFCSWPSTDFVCPFKEATRAEGAIMAEVLAHLDELVYDPNTYNGSWLVWQAFGESFPDVRYAFGLTEDEVKAPEALERDGIYQRRSASRDFGPDEPLTKAVWAEWLYNAFHSPTIGPPKQVPVIAPSSP